MGKIAVIGGGPAGLMASISASSRGNEVILIERNEAPGRKLLITGGGRCNLTNLCEVEEFMENVPSNGQFLFTSLYTLSPSSLVDTFGEWGLGTVVEDGGRVFPESGRSADVLKVLKDRAEINNVRILKGNVRSIDTADGRVTSLDLEDDGRLDVDSVVLATGGITYPSTGSNGDGYEMVKSLGHTIINPEPRIRSWKLKGSGLKDLQGMTLDDVHIKAGNATFRGPLLFTHDGITGPAVFDADLEAGDRFPMDIRIDLVPDTSGEKIGSRIDSARETNPRRKLSSVMAVFTSRRLGIRILELLGIPPDLELNQLRRDMKRELIATLKELKVTVIGADDRHAMITAGGICLDEVDPATMGSKKIEGLYFAGEVLDLHARTGGFNLHIAFSTGYMAGENC